VRVGHQRRRGNTVPNDPTHADYISLGREGLRFGDLAKGHGAGVGRWFRAWRACASGVRGGAEAEMDR